MSFDLAGLFAAGLLTFASPCILPLVPLYLATLGGTSVSALREGKRSRRLLASTGAFGAGLAAVFVGLGLGASAAGRLLAEYRGPLLAVSGTIMVAFGLRFLGVLRLPFLDRERRPWLGRVSPGGSLLASFAFGGAFALGWTPCIGPVLGSVLTYTASAGASPARGALYLGVYAAGLVVPLLAAAAFAPAVLRLLDGAKRHLRKLEIATGVLLVGTGALLATDRLILLMPSTGPSAELAVELAAPVAPAALAATPSGAADAGICVDGEGTTCALPAATGAPALDGAALDAAAASAGPAMVEVMSRSCPICRRMEPVVAEARRSCGHVHVEQAYVEESRGSALARRHGVRGVPTFLVLDAKGREVSRLVGEQPLAALVDAMQQVSPQLCGAWPAGAAERSGS